jgi:hypothetical protein
VQDEGRIRLLSLSVAAHPEGLLRRQFGSAQLAAVAKCAHRHRQGGHERHHLVGALLMFSLMIGPPAAARLCTDRPARALGLSVLLALATVWLSIAAAYLSNWPVGFFVGGLGAVWNLIGRGVAAWRAQRVGAPRTRALGAISV